MAELPIKRKKTVQKMFSITPMTVEMVKQLAELEEFWSQSDVIRKAVIDLHNKHFPKQQPELGIIN